MEVGLMTKVQWHITLSLDAEYKVVDDIFDTVNAALELDIHMSTTCDQSTMNSMKRVQRKISGCAGALDGLY